MLTRNEQRKELATNTAPGAVTLDYYRRCGLVAYKELDGGDLQFPSTMMTKAIDQKLRELFPRLFEYLDEQDYNTPGQLHWVLAAKYGTTMAMLAAVQQTQQERT